MPRGAGGGFRLTRPLRGESLRVAGPFRIVGQKPLQPMRKIGVGAAESPLREQHGESGGAFGFVVTRGLEQHARQARRQWQRAHGAAGLREPSILVQRAEIAVERQRFVPRGSGRRVEPFELRRIAHAPGGEIERE